MTKIVHVAVAVIMNEDNQVCISLRHNAVHQGGLWEFPGGKVEQGETIEQALVREIKEELGLSIKSSRPLIKFSHNYPEVTVCLHVLKVQSFRGQVTSMEAQEIKWVHVSQLFDFNFPAANATIISAIQLPERYLITGKFLNQKDFTSKLNNAFDNNIRLLQLRLNNENLAEIKNPQQFIEDMSVMCERESVELLLNLSAQWKKIIDLDKIKFSGFHLDSRSLMSLSARPEGKLLSASCHNKRELEKAQKLKVDFLVLSPVQKTTSHPDMDAMGWETFSKLIDEVTIPVYALGGLSEKDLPIAWENGAQGVAAIGAFWQK